MLPKLVVVYTNTTTSGGVNNHGGYYTMNSIPKTRELLLTCVPDMDMHHEIYNHAYAKGQVQEAERIAQDWIKHCGGSDHHGVAKFIRNCIDRRIEEAMKKRFGSAS